MKKTIERAPERRLKITWKRYGDFPDEGRYATSAEIALLSEESAEEICERVFEETNTYSGEIWKIIKPLLDPRRTHTALSVGDEVEIDGVTLRCEDIGWSRI